MSTVSARVARVSLVQVIIIAFYMGEKGGYRRTGPIQRTIPAMSSKLEATF